MADHRRFFVPASCLDQNVATLTGPIAHQIKNVLRLRVGDRVKLLDNSGWSYEVRVEMLEQDAVIGAIQGKVLAGGEPRTKITIFQGLLRPNQFETVLQKATEVGVCTIVPTICQRCVVGHLDDGSTHKMTRWERIVTEAAEQCGRGKIPALRPAMLLEQACEQVRGLSLLTWEDEHSVSLRAAMRQSQGSFTANKPAVEPRSGTQRPFSINLFVGPEGGFAPHEVAMARGYGIATITLGPRILRAETAAIVAAALLLHEAGDLER